MRKLTTLILFACLLNSCGYFQNKKSPNQQTLLDYKDKFKYKNLIEFSIDTFEDGGQKRKFYNELDSIAFRIIWQDKAIRENQPNDDYDMDFYYSWQERDTDFTELTILYQYEADWCTNIDYLIYNKSSKLISKFLASAQCADGGWIYLCSGRFIDKNTYEQINIETEAMIEDSTEYMDGDSVINHITILPDGSLKQKEVYNKHFTDFVGIVKFEE